MTDKKEMSIDEWSKFLINKKGKTELYQKIGDDLDFLNFPVVSRNYLKKAGWMTDHYIGYLRTGEKVPEPTQEEMLQLKSVLLQLSDKLRSVAEKL